NVSPDAAVVGAEVAERFGYAPGAVIVNAHGAGAVAFDMHDDAPFTITGILAPTGTAVDRMVFVTLQGFDEIHASRTPPPEDPFDIGAAGQEPVGAEHSDTAGDVNDPHEGEHGHSEELDDHHHEPETINAVFVGLSDRTAILSIQRTFSELRTDPVSAVMPAVALAELWGITGTAENVMRAMAWAVALAGLIGMLVMLSATLDTRRREFAILRSVGATPPRIFGLIITEAAVLVGAGLLFGLVLLTLATFVANPILLTRFGVTLGLGGFGLWELTVIGMIFCAGLVTAFIPAFRVYRITLADGLSVRI
ncbi:MAG: ABC transporter permease, partial [Roseobacter sp.]